METRDTTAVRVDRDREPGPANWFAIDRIDHDQVHGRVIHLNQVQRMPGGRCMAMHRLRFRMLLAAASHVSERQRLEAASNRVGRWDGQFLRATPADDLANNPGRGRLLWREIEFANDPLQRGLTDGCHAPLVPAAT